jgi:hypothetical protein
MVCFNSQALQPKPQEQSRSGHGITARDLASLITAAPTTGSRYSTFDNYTTGALDTHPGGPSSLWRGHWGTLLIEVAKEVLRLFVLFGAAPSMWN